MAETKHAVTCHGRHNMVEPGSTESNPNIFNFTSSFNDSKKAKTNKHEAETKYKYSQIKSFSSRLAEMRCSIDSSVAIRNTLPNTALTARKNDFSSN